MLLLSACNTEPVKNPPRLQVQKQKLSQKPEPIAGVKAINNPANSHLQNADKFVQASEFQAAQQEVDAIVFTDLSPEQRSQYNLLEAQIALSTGDAEHALVMLDTAKPKLLSKTDQIRFYQSLAFAHALMGNVLPGVSARISLGGLLPKPLQAENMTSILDALKGLPPAALMPVSGRTEELSGWMDLARILQQNNQTETDIDEEIQLWRLKFPGHPASDEFIKSYQSKKTVTQSAWTDQESKSAPPKDTVSFIAVLLPESGTYAQAGNAVKEGLLAAHKLASTAVPQLPVKFYNSEQSEITALYKQAVAEGAKKVIGPLVREQVQALSESADLPIPVLALNHADSISKINLYQFGLSPIDEAEELVLKARGDGRQTAFLLTPNTSQGQRIAGYLTSAWQSHGGVLTTIRSYDPKQHDIAAVLNELIGTKAESSIQKQLTVLLSATPEIGRQLAPQLKYHQNGNLAVYAMPSIYTGYPDPVQDSELGSITFCDIPSLFAGVYKGSQLSAVLQSRADNQIRLRALGMDAYNLLEHLTELSSVPYAGVTGKLSLNAENRITRKLVCAQFQGGIPVVSGTVE